MTDIPAQPPPSPGVPTPQAQPAPEPPNAWITALPPDLDNIQETIRLRGEIFQARADGVVRIMTDAGEIDVRLEPGQPVPAKGDTVQVEIQPGQPPRTARVTIENASTPRPAPEAEAPPPRSVQTPVEVSIRDKVDVPKTQAPPPLPEIPVRLQPIPVEEVAQYIPEPLEITLSTVQEKIDLQTQILVLEIEEELAVLSVPVKPAGNENQKPVIPGQLTTLAETIAPVKIDPEATIILVKPPVPTIKALQVQIQPQQAIVILKPVLASLTTPVAQNNPGASTPAAPLAVPALVTGLENLPQKPADMIHVRLSAMEALSAGLPEIDGKIPVKLQAAVTTEPLILQNQKAGTITATVIGHTPDKFPVIGFMTPQTATLPQKGSFFILNASAAMPELLPGTEIVLTPQPDGTMTMTMPVATASVPIPVPLSFMTPEAWPLMDELYEALAQIMPQAAQAFSNAMPSPARPEQLGPAALFFLAAVKGGDLTAWLGERATDLLRRAGRAGLISKLGSEGMSLNRLAAGPVAQEWRAMSLPLYWEGEIHKLALYYKQDSQSGKNGPEGGKQVRFLFDLNLDNMGKVQLDGLFRPKRLDLIVRSEAPFSQSMQMQMRRSYINALELTQVSGELSFQNKPEQWVTIKSERQKFGTSA
jgi:hypothetical protein